MPIASVRILRMVLGTALCLFFSQIVNWPMSFVAAVFTMFILALPLPAMSLAGGLKFAIVFLVAVYGSLIFLPFVVHYPLAGLLLVALALYHSFYFTARGGSSVLGAFATVGITLVASVGSVSIDAIIGLLGGLTTGILVGISFVWIAHALIPDSKADVAQHAPTKPPAAEKPDLAAARSSAFRSLLVVMPVVVWFMLSGASASYAAVMIKVASMGQQASLDHTKQAAKSLLASTIIGGIGAIVAWQILSIRPDLLLFVLLVALGGLVMGPKIFQGLGLAPQGPTWSYAYLTMIVILGPAVMDSQTGDAAGSAFYGRLLMFMFASFYGVAAVYVFDHLTSFKAGNRETAGADTA